MNANREPYQDLRDYIEARDTLYRFAAGMDYADPALVASAFAADAVLDFTDTAQKLGRAIPILQGRDQIVQVVLTALMPFTTYHTISNQEITPVGDHARFTALVQAQYVLKHDQSWYLLLKNVYAGELVREATVWVFQTLHITNVSYSGELLVLSGQ